MICLSCGSNGIRGKTCSYCGAAVDVSSIFALRSLPTAAVNAFRSDLAESKLTEISSEDQVSAMLTQVLVLLEKNQWRDAMVIAEKARERHRDVVCFAQYSLIAAVAGNFLRQKALDDIHATALLLVNARDSTNQFSNLNGYVVSCINETWCAPNKIKYFDAPKWEVDDEVIAVSQFFYNPRLSKASLLFNRDGSSKEFLDEAAIAKRERIEEIVKSGDYEIAALVSKHRFTSFEALVQGIEKQVKKPEKARGMIDVLLKVEGRKSGYLEDSQPFMSDLGVAISKGRQSTPFFGGGAAKQAFIEICKVLEAELKKVRITQTHL